MNAPTPSQLKKIAEQVRKHHGTPCFDSTIKKALGEQYTSSVAFHVKGEVARLNRPSKRPFRIEQYYSNVEIIEVKHNGVIHHLDSISKPEFVRVLANYDNNYTTGVEEHMALFSKKSKDEYAHSVATKDVEVFPLDLTERAFRQEERVHIAVKSTLFEINDNAVIYKDIESQLKSSLEVLTKNISNSGLLVRADAPFIKGQRCYVRFDGLEKSYIFSQPYIAYECVGGGEDDESSTKSKKHLWALRRLEIGGHKEFNLFMKKGILSNKLRFQVDLDHIEKSVVNHVAEQFMINRQEEFTLFSQANGLAPVAFGSHLGIKEFNHFTHNHKSLLNELFIKDNLIERSKGKGVYWAVIRQANGALFSAPLDGTDVNSEFFKYALTREDAKVFHVTTQDVDSNNAYLTHNLPEDLRVSKQLKRQRKLTDFYAESTKNIVNKLVYASTIKSLDRDLVTSLFGSLTKLTKDHQAIFSQFSVKSSGKFTVRFVQARRRELRKEDRFVLKTPVRIEVGDEILEGHTRDISESGCCVKLKSKTLSLKGANIKVLFEYFDPDNGKTAFVRYNVIDDSKGMLRLKAKGDNNVVLSFIDNHFDSLEPIEEKGAHGAHLHGLERALRNLQNTVNPYTKALMQFGGAGPIPTHVAVSKAEHDPLYPTGGAELHEPCQRYKKMLCNMSLQKQLSKDFREINTELPFIRHLLMVAVDEQTGVPRVSKFYETENMKSDAIRSIHSLLSKKGCVVHWFQVDVTRKSRIFDRYYREELNYIESMASYRGETIYQMIKKTAGVFSITPLTGILNIKKTTSALSQKAS